MKRGTCETGTEMSCLRLAPSLRCASGMDSRSRQNISRSRSLSATLAFRTQPDSSASASVFSSRASSGSLARDVDSSHSTYQSACVSSGSATPGICRRVRSTAMRGINSKELTQSPLPSRSAPSSDTAASGSRTATKAVARDLSAGYSLRQAAVMMPSVPSAPRNSDFTSYPVLSLRSPVSVSSTRPSASTTSRPSTSSRAMP